MNESINNFAWSHQLECPLTICNDSVKKILCKGVMELLWEDIGNSAFPVADACKIRKNIFLYKLKHGLNNSKCTVIRELSQLRSKHNALKHEITVLGEDYEEQDYAVRQKMQQLKQIKSNFAMIGRRKDFLKLKYSETNQQVKDFHDMRQMFERLMPNTSKDIDQHIFRDNLNVVAGLRLSTDKKQVRQKVSNSLGNIDTHTLWTHVCQTLSQDVDRLMKQEIKNDVSNSTVVGQNIDIGIARACGQHLYMKSKTVLSNSIANKHQQLIMEFIDNIELLSVEDISEWLTLTLEIKKLEAEQTHLQNEVQILKNGIQDSYLLNLEVTQLTADIETIDTQMDKYVKDIQQSIAVLNSTALLISKAKKKLHHELQKIVTLQASNYNPKLDNSLNIELNMFYNTLDLNALRKIMLRGDVKQYRHAVCGFNETSIVVPNSQCSKIKSCFPMIQTPIHSLIECYKNMVANINYTKLEYPMPMKDIERIDTSSLRSLQEKCKYDSLDLLKLSKVAYGQIREEIKQFDEILNSWMNQDVQEAMVLSEGTVDDVSFISWLERYNLLLYMIQNVK